LFVAWVIDHLDTRDQSTWHRLTPHKRPELLLRLYPQVHRLVYGAAMSQGVLAAHMSEQSEAESAPIMGNKPKNDDDMGAWIFLSHSHKDIKEVRRVRDALEAKGHNPLLFFLKCLDDNSELEGLIRREIEARKFFLLCDSPNAQSARWVQKEVELIKSMAGKVYRTIDLVGAWQPQLDAIDDLSRHATVYLSYSRADTHIAAQYAQTLRAHDFSVLKPEDVTPGVAWQEQIETMIDTALATGTVVVLISPESMTSRWVAHEALYALRRKQEGVSNVWPLIVRDRDKVVNLLYTLPEWAPFREIAFGELTPEGPLPPLT
jgi:hypothetical protein